jgi:hypothetical protein
MARAPVSKTVGADPAVSVVVLFSPVLQEVLLRQPIGHPA